MTKLVGIFILDFGNYVSNKRTFLRCYTFLLITLQLQIRKTLTIKTLEVIYGILCERKVI